MAADPQVRPVSSVNIRMARSQQTFLEHIWPKIRQKFGDCELIPAEGVDGSPLAKMIDFAGIDYFLDRGNADPFGIAQRTNERRPGDRMTEWPWNTITMGVPQFDRLVRARQAPFGHLAPAVIVQSYVTRRPDGAVSVDSIGIVRTNEFMAHATTVSPCRKEWSGAPFYYWSFDDLTTAGVPVDRFPSPFLQTPFGRIEAQLALPPGAA